MTRGNLNYIDLTGNRYGKLTVIKRIEKPKEFLTNGIYWLCKCDCGRERIVSRQCLISRDTRSCESCGKPNRRGVSSGSRENRIPDATINSLIKCYKYEAKIRNLNYDLDKDFIKIITKQNCFYCGQEPNNTFKGRGKADDYVYNGIDRIDSTKGYTEDNVVACCYMCNIAKHNWEKDVFLDWAKRVYEHNFKS